MKKAMILLDDYDILKFKKKYSLGILDTYKRYKHGSFVYHVYEIDEESHYKLDIGIDDEDVLIAHDCCTDEYFKVCEGVQNSLYLLFTDYISAQMPRASQNDLS